MKTTDAYRMAVETVATYRSELIKAGQISEEKSSILLVVGREDTGELEAQIRGSRFAWDVRLISVDALIRLLRIRQEVEDPATESKIRSLLVPREYTRLDEIIDLVFSTTEDVGDDDLHHHQNELSGSHEVELKGVRPKPVSFNDSVAEKLGVYLGVDLTKRSRVVFSDTESGHVVLCAVSKSYEEARGHSFWFAFHPHQLEKLEGAVHGYAAFGCGSASNIVLIPVDRLKEQLENLHRTQREDGRSYWHIKIFNEGEAWVLNRRSELGPLDISESLIT